jgi:hypothetical protein
MVSPSTDVLVGGEGQELDEVLAYRYFFKDPASKVQSVAVLPFGFEEAGYLLGDPSHQ